MSVRKQSIIATLAISGSRVAGLVREMAFAFFFGASPVLDAFIAAFRIPNLLRDLFCEGALSQAFVSVFSKLKTQKGNKDSWALANQVQSFILLTVGGLAILGMIFSPQILQGVASGFLGAKFEFTVMLNRILFPFILFVALAALTMGMLNTLGHFALPQSASTFFNLTSIIAGLGLATYLAPSSMMATWAYLFNSGASPKISWEEATRAMLGMALGTVLGGLVQWGIQLPSLWRLGFRPHWKLNFKDPLLKQVLKLTIPAVIGGAAVQINVLVNTNFASYLEDGSMGWLNYAFRFMQFPLGVFGVAVASATAPALASLLAQGEIEKMKTTLRDSTSLTLFLCVPSALGLMILAEPIIGLIYEHGRFTQADTLQAALALKAYSAGLIFYALIKIYQPAFLAFGNARTPMLVSLGSIFLNAILNWVFVFIFHWTHWGLALGTSFVALWNGILLTVLLRHKLPGIWTRDLFKTVFKISTAALLAILLGWSSYRELLFFMGKGGFLKNCALVFTPMILTVLTYAFFCTRFKVTEAMLLMQKIRTRLGR